MGMGGALLGRSLSPPRLSKSLALQIMALGQQLQAASSRNWLTMVFQPQKCQEGLSESNPLNDFWSHYRLRHRDIKTSYCLSPHLQTPNCHVSFPPLHRSILNSPLCEGLKTLKSLDCECVFMLSRSQKSSSSRLESWQRILVGSRFKVGLEEPELIASTIY